MLYCIRGAASCPLMRSKTHHINADKPRIVRDCDISHLLRCAPSVWSVIWALALSLDSSRLKLFCWALIQHMHLYYTYIPVGAVLVLASSALSLEIDDQSASASHAQECLRNRHAGGSCWLGESSYI
ncbi:hypothetical protein GGI43DRAFT_12064 [Trichoderma evansii]